MQGNKASTRIEISGGIKELVGNPSALGLLGLAIVTSVASSQKLGLTSGTAGLVGWAIFLGAIGQLMAGWLDYKHENAFGATAFCGYGLFWLGVAFSWMTQLGMFGLKAQEVFDIRQLGVAFLAYFVFSLIMTAVSMETNKVLFAIFVLIDFLFLGLSMNLLAGSHWGHRIAAWSELFIAIGSFYALAANVMNTHYGRVIIPVGRAFGPWLMGREQVAVNSHKEAVSQAVVECQRLPVTLDS